MATQDAVYKILVDTSEGSQQFAKLKNDAIELGKNANIDVKADTSKAGQALDGLKNKVTGIGGASVPINADASKGIQSINELKQQLNALNASKGSATTVQDLGAINSAIASTEAELKRLHKTTEDSLDPFEKLKTKAEGVKEKVSGLAGSFGAGFLAGGALQGAEHALEATKVQLESEEKLKIALRQTGAEGENLNKKFTESQALVAGLSTEFARPSQQVRGLVSEIAGLGGVSGAQAKQVAEIGIAFDQIGIPAKALKGIIRGAVDPESAAALDQLKTKFPALAGALNSATDAGGKLKAVYGAITPTLEGIREAADGPLGQMQKMDETSKNVERSFGGLLFSALTPFLGILDTVSTVLNATVIPVLGSVTGFINDNKTAVLVLVGAYAAFRTVSAINDVGGISKVFAKGAEGAKDLYTNIVTKLIPGYGAKAAAEGVSAAATGAEAAATEGATVAQSGLNAALKANPIGAVIGVLSILVSGFLLLYNNVGFVRNAVDGFWNVLKATGAFIGTFVKTTIGGLSDAFAGASKVISGILHLNLGEVVSGAKQTAHAVTDALGGGIKAGADSFKKSMDESKVKAKAAGDQATTSFGEAKKAIDATAESADNLGKSFDEQIKQFDEAAHATVANVAALKNNLRTTTDPAEREKIRQDIQFASTVAKQQIEQLNLRKKIQTDTNNEFFKEVKAHGDILATIKKEAEEKSKALETDLRLERARANQVFSARDELAVQQKFTSELTKGIEANDLLHNKKFAVKAQLLLDEGSIKDLEIKAKIRADLEKLKTDLNAAADGLFKKEIEVGIRPKSDSIALIDTEIARIQAQLDKVHIPAFDPLNIEPFYQALTKSQNLEAQLDGLNADRDKQQREQSNTLRDLRIQNEVDVLSNQKSVLDLRVEQGRIFGDDAIQQQRNIAQQELDIETTKINIQLEKDLEYFRLREEFGLALTQQEEEQKAAITQRYESQIQALRLKFAKDFSKQQTSIEKATSDALFGIYKTLTDKREKLSKEEIDEKLLGYDKERTALIAKLQRGEVSEREYNVQVAKLNSDRSKFQQSLDNSVWGALKKNSKDALGSLIKDAEDYLARKAILYTLDALFNASAEATKTVDTVAGTGERIAANSAETGSNVVNSGSKLLSGLADEIAKSIAFLGPIAGPIAGLAEVGIIIGAFAGIKSLLGFQTGGIGVIGEAGPEVVAPMKDFSSMIGSLVSGAVKATEKSLGGDRGGASNKLNVSVSGSLKQRGRDLDYSLKRDAVSRKTERMVPV